MKGNELIEWRKREGSDLNRDKSAPVSSRRLIEMQNCKDHELVLTEGQLAPFTSSYWSEDGCIPVA